MKKTIKAFVIESEEYKYNAPHVFLFVKDEDGKVEYYGDRIYPAIRDYPEDIGYWYRAHSSDSDRFFKVTEVDFPLDKLLELQNLRAAIEGNSKAIKNYPPCENQELYDEISRYNMKFASAHAEALKNSKDIITNVLLKHEYDKSDE